MSTRETKLRPPGRFGNRLSRATAQDAFANGFDVVVPREATNSNRPHLAADSLEDIDRYTGSVAPLEAALAMLA